MPIKRNKTNDHVIFPDIQQHHGISTDLAILSADYCWDTRPTVIGFLGDVYDLPSLCSYTKKQLCMEGLRLQEDLEAGYLYLKTFCDRLQWRREKAKEKNKTTHRGSFKYNPRIFFVMGNHEFRLIKLINELPELAKSFGYGSFRLEELGIEYCEFMDHIDIDGVLYQHYVTTVKSPAAMGNAQTILKTYHQSVVVGHAPGLDYAISSMSPNGHPLQCIVAGSFYEHEEKYRPRVCNNHWRGFLHLYNVHDGAFDPHFISIDLLRKWYA